MPDTYLAEDERALVEIDEFLEYLDEQYAEAVYQDLFFHAGA